MTKLYPRCNYCDTKEMSLGKCRFCSHFEFPADQITEDCGIYTYQGKAFYMKRTHPSEKPYEMPITFSHFLFRQSQQRIAELEEKLEKVNKTLQDLMDRIEFAPDGEEAAEAVKRWTNFLK